MTFIDIKPSRLAACAFAPSAASMASLAPENVQKVAKSCHFVPFLWNSYV